MRRLAFGGPWYGSKVDIRLMVSILGLVANGPKHGLQPDTLLSTDGMLDLGRNQLMVQALASGCDWFVSVDADCSFIGQVPALAQAIELYDMHDDVALVAAPVRCGAHDNWNVVAEGARDTSSIRPELGPVSRAGFGLVAFKLRWYQTHWPRVTDYWPPFFETHITADNQGGFKSLSEDHDHCMKVQSFGGRVVCDPRIVVKHHVVRAGHPLSRHE